MSALFRIILLILIGTLILTGCENNSKWEWFNSKEAAIANKLANESLDEKAIVAVEEIDGASILVYLDRSSLIFSNLIEDDNRYAIAETSGAYGFKGSAKIKTAVSEIKIDSNKDYSLLVGQILSDSAEQVVLSTGTMSEKLNTIGGTGLFYKITADSIDLDLIEIEPVEE